MSFSLSHKMSIEWCCVCIVNCEGGNLKAHQCHAEGKNLLRFIQEKFVWKFDEAVFPFYFHLSKLEHFFLATLSGNKTEILLLSALNLIKFKDAS